MPAFTEKMTLEGIFIIYARLTVNKIKARFRSFHYRRRPKDSFLRSHKIKHPTKTKTKKKSTRQTKQTTRQTMPFTITNTKAQQENLHEVRLDNHTSTLDENQDQDLQYGYKEEDRSDTSLIKLLIQLVLPFLFYNLFTTEGRRQYCDLITEDPLNNIISWVPFILIMMLQNVVNPSIALLVATALSFVKAGFEYYHSTYKTQYPKFYYLTWCFCICFLLLSCVLWSPLYKPTNNLSIYINTFMFFAILLSLVSCKPFTKQMGQHKVPIEIQQTTGYHKLNMVLTFIWVVIFFILAGCAWIITCLGSHLSNTGFFFINTFIPLATVIGGIYSMPMVIGLLKDRLDTTPPSTKSANTSDNKDNETVDVATTAETITDIKGDDLV